MLSIEKLKNHLKAGKYASLFIRCEIDNTGYVEDEIENAAWTIAGGNEKKAKHIENCINRMKERILKYYVLTYYQTLYNEETIPAELWEKLEDAIDNHYLYYMRDIVQPIKDYFEDRRDRERIETIYNTVEDAIKRGDINDTWKHWAMEKAIELKAELYDDLKHLGGLESNVIENMKRDIVEHIVCIETKAYTRYSITPRIIESETQLIVKHSKLRTIEINTKNIEMFIEQVIEEIDDGQTAEDNFYDELGNIYLY